MIFGVRRPYDPRPLWMLDEWMRELQSSGALGSGGFGDLPSFDQEDGKFVLRVEVPGLEANEVDVQVHERTVTIRAEHQDAVPEGHRVLRRERGGDVQMVRTVTLPGNANPDACNAALRDGILTLTFEQRERKGPRRIELGSDGRA